jgi:hypothetical protein
MKGGKYIPPNRKRLADDLLDKAEARETESLKDVLTRLARQKKSGSIVLDGRKSISKLPMVNFLFHCADGTWLLECVDTSDWRSEMEEDETKGDWIFHKVVEHIDTLNKMAGAEVVDQVITDSAGDCKKARRLLKEKYGGKICVSACAAHTLDLLLEDIGKLKRFARTIATMRDGEGDHEPRCHPARVLNADLSHARAFEPQAMGYCPPRPRTCRGVGADRAQLGCHCCEWAAECWPRAMVARLVTERGQWGTGLVPRVPKLRNSGRNQESGIRFRYRPSQIPVPSS